MNEKGQCAVTHFALIGFESNQLWDLFVFSFSISLVNAAKRDLGNPLCECVTTLLQMNKFSSCVRVKVVFYITFV